MDPRLRGDDLTFTIAEGFGRDAVGERDESGNTRRDRRDRWGG